MVGAGLIKGLKPRLGGGTFYPRAEARGNGISSLIQSDKEVRGNIDTDLFSVAPGFSPEIKDINKIGASAPYRFVTFLILLIFVMFYQPLSAQEHSNFFPILGGQRAGTSAYTFLKIGVGARSMAMGGAFIAVANDASSIFWNPAGAVMSENARGIFVDHNEWVAGIQSENLAAIYQFRGIHSLGISATSIHTDPMEITTEYLPNGTGEYFNYGDMMFGLSYAMKMTDRFSFGITGKIV
ncbi:MAG: hypothetical protein COY19_01800, partial [Candidatus Marinimicrobia bacterium CG_4_10_14_0_2_um_filter_48_9]